VAKGIASIGAIETGATLGEARAGVVGVKQLLAG